MRDQGFQEFCKHGPRQRAMERDGATGHVGVGTGHTCKEGAGGRGTGAGPSEGASGFQRVVGWFVVCPGRPA
jgi:hypothetical protein